MISDGNPCLCPKNRGDFKKITGKNPTSFKTWMKQHEAMFKGLKIPPPPAPAVNEDEKKEE